MKQVQVARRARREEDAQEESQVPVTAANAVSEAAGQWLRDNPGR